MNSVGGLKHVGATKDNYAHVTRFHRDVRTYSSHLTLMMNVLIMLEDFTVENGATRLLPGSHKQKDKPPEKVFLNDAIHITGSAGSVLLFDSNVWHSASPNLDGSTRAAITLSYTRPFVKQQMDYCHLVGPNFSEDQRNGSNWFSIAYSA